jgi:hypothetical protein
LFSLSHIDNNPAMRPKLLVLLMVLDFLLAGSSAAAEKRGVSTLAWLQGTWSSEKNNRVVTEQWMAPDGGTMLGASRTVAGGKTVEYEFLMIREDANGDVFFVAKPSGQKEASFKLVKGSDREVVFENSEHDFPQRILYTRKDDGSLLAEIEATQKGKARRVEFLYRKVNP